VPRKKLAAERKKAANEPPDEPDAKVSEDGYGQPPAQSAPAGFPESARGGVAAVQDQNALVK
jgi:hypothetical protein